MAALSHWKKCLLILICTSVLHLGSNIVRQTLTCGCNANKLINLTHVMLGKKPVNWQTFQRVLNKLIQIQQQK